MSVCAARKGWAVREGTQQQQPRCSEERSPDASSPARCRSRKGYRKERFTGTERGLCPRLRVSAAAGAAASAPGPGDACACVRLGACVVLVCISIPAGIIRQPCWTLPEPQKRGFVVVLGALLLDVALAGGVRRGDAARQGGAGDTRRGAHNGAPVFGRAGRQQQPEALRRTSRKHTPVCFTSPTCIFL